MVYGNCNCTHYRPIKKFHHPGTASWQCFNRSQVYHIIRKIYSAPITLYKTMGALHGSWLLVKKLSWFKWMVSNKSRVSNTSRGRGQKQVVLIEAGASIRSFKVSYQDRPKQSHQVFLSCYSNQVPLTVTQDWAESSSPRSNVCKRAIAIKNLFDHSDHRRLEKKEW